MINQTNQANAKRICILVSGSGTNMQAIIDGVNSGEINAQICAVIASNDSCYALQRAKDNNIPFKIFSINDYECAQKRDESLLIELKKLDLDYIILAGYLGVLSGQIICEFEHKIVNIHPSLLPSYGGKGFYGIKVHQAVIKARESFSGATAHFVDAGVDTGLIIAQQKLEVLPTDTPEILQQKILKNIEHSLLKNVVKDLCDDKIFVQNNKVIYLKD